MVARVSCSPRTNYIIVSKFRSMSSLFRRPKRPPRKTERGRERGREGEKDYDDDGLLLRSLFPSLLFSLRSLRRRQCDACFCAFRVLFFFKNERPFRPLSKNGSLNPKNPKQKQKPLLFSSLQISVLFFREREKSLVLLGRWARPSTGR